MLMGGREGRKRLGGGIWDASVRDNVALRKVWDSS